MATEFSDAWTPAIGARRGRRSIHSGGDSAFGPESRASVPDADAVEASFGALAGRAAKGGFVLTELTGRTTIERDLHGFLIRAALASYRMVIRSIAWPGLGATEGESLAQARRTSGGQPGRARTGMSASGRPLRCPTRTATRPRRGWRRSTPPPPGPATASPLRPPRNGSAPSSTTASRLATTAARATATWCGRSPTRTTRSRCRRPTGHSGTTRPIFVLAGSGGLSVVLAVYRS
jgi:hypothetical protein